MYVLLGCYEYKTYSVDSDFSSSECDCVDSICTFFIFNLLGNLISFRKNHVITRRKRGGKRLFAHSITEFDPSVSSLPTLIRNMKEM